MAHFVPASPAFPLIPSLLLLFALAGCTAAPPPPVRQEAPQQTAPDETPAAATDAAPAFKGTLKDYLGHTLRSQYASSLNLYTPPPAGLEKDFHLQLNLEPATLILGNEVTAYAAGENGLAMGFANGQVRVFSSFACPGLILPGNQGVSMLSWSPESPFLAAVGSDRKETYVFDLRRGAVIGERAFNATLTGLALSPPGTWLAVSDSMHTLWTGPAAGGPMTKVASLRYETIGLSFTPQGGLLLAVDAAGWITMWAPLTKKLVDKVQVPFGPFARAEFNDRFVILHPEEGPAARWDLPARKAVKEEAAPSPFVLKNGVLTYKTYTPRPVKKMHMAPASFSVEYSPKLKLIRVRDVDGETRFYNQDGQPAGLTGEAPDYESAPVDQDGRFQVKGRKYALAERIFQKEHSQLFCRYIPGQGYFLWWTSAPRPMEFNPKPGALPRRAGISADEPAVWTPVEPSDQLL